MWVYQCLDILSTVVEMACLYIISGILLKESRFHTSLCKYIPPIIMFMVTWILTWFSGLGAFKMPIIFIVAFIVLQVSYKESIYQTVIAIEIWFICCIFLVEAFVYPVSKFIFNNMLLVVIDGQNILRWEVYVIAIAIRIVSLIIIYEVLKNFKYKIKANDCAVLSTVFMIGFAALMFSVYNVLNLSKIPHILIFFSLTIFILIFLIVFLYSKNTMFLREQEQKDKMQIAQLQQQFAYYQEKLKDEEKVRSVYHDMKNHLLVLQRQINSPETAEMVEKLQSQVAMYEDYDHTGNDILDIILKEKSETAREKHIALSVTADLNGVDFIEPLDVSTIFGNGLDNAIEASEKLPEEQRAILVKAGRVQNFFSVLIENSCLQNREYTKQRTTKSDDFLHGFGISNMRKAAEKYDGQLTIKCENEKFTLKILIPIP
ncbi:MULTISPECIES: GHKL domain-containing protein [Lachnospiraceae]|uniref:GHKL domain-containing protein n=1 Tax=Lachnospiraceae TaxID=186803 RepID=UPI0035618223